MRIAVLIPGAGYPVEWRWAYDIEAQALIDAGADVRPVRWTDERDFDGFELILPLVAWGYHKDYGRWLRLLDRLERERVPVSNPTPLLRWNGDKAYLAELERSGIATVPTLVIDEFDDEALRKAHSALGADIVVKPPVSASAWGTFRLREGDPLPEDVRGWRMLAQPWIRSITTTGEYSLIFFGGEFSHAVSKVPARGEFRVQPEYGGIIARCDPPAGAVEIARSALDAAPGAACYARVDLVGGNEGGLQVIELELIEPALFLDQAPDRCASFAAAVFEAARSSSEQPLPDRGREVGRR